MALPKFGTDEYKFPDEVDDTPVKTEEDKFEVEIEDDTPPEDRGRKPMKEPVEDPTEDELASYDEKVQARIKKFTRGYHDERRAKEQAERERLAAEDFARQVFEENQRLKQTLNVGSQAFIETSKSAAQIELDVAKKKLKEAFEAGDSDALAAAQEELSKATMKIDRAQQMAPVRVEPEQFPVLRQPMPQPVELTPRTKKWVDRNSDWFGVDDEMTMLAMGLDKKLQREYGADYIGTEDYFKEIDRAMKKRFPDYFRSHEDDDDPSQNSSDPAEDGSPRRASRSTPVAPATRSTPPNRVKLKASQVALARKLGITPEQYAKQVALLGRN